MDESTDEPVSAERFAQICDTFRPSPHSLSDYQFGRFSRAWKQPRACPDGRDPVEFCRGWDDVEAEHDEADDDDSDLE